MKKLLYSIIIILLLTIIVLLYGRFIGVNGLETKEYVIYNNKIDTSYDGLKIIHLSDLHYKKVITEKRVKELIKEINQNNPDIVIISGDLLDKDYNLTADDINFLITELTKIESTYGTYAIPGDNDYLKTETLKNIYIQSNITLLDNNYSIIKNEHNIKILISGLNTYTYDEADITKTEEYLTTNKDLNYKILIMHEPDYLDKININNFDLILAGHSLNGSINIPIIRNLFLEKNAKKYNKEHYQINNTEIYISNGIGVSNLNFRINNTPSINVYRIRK